MNKIKQMIKDLGLVEKKNKVKEKVKKIIELKDKAKYITLLGKKYQTYYENSNKYWWKRDYKIIGKEIKEVYFENSNNLKMWYEEKDTLKLENGIYYLNDVEMEIKNGNKKQRKK